ncbi:type II toxin-antitoxin system VapC family toxin [Ammonicoccus fulvus]|uniref:Ribonuclease VapC n=1 Tax=Ammonicoccus fulvus TaxID=3138240 RepID=A0ABZ3FRZ0_9ACTN
MTILLDTNVISELRKRPGVVNPRVAAWADAQDTDDLRVSVITVMEIELGVLLVERRDPAQGNILRAWFERAVLGDLSRNLLPVDLAVVRLAAALHVPDPRPERDAYIAATALVHGLTVATRNVADFSPMGVPVLNPWAS